ncbi:MAG: alpha/beta fold hydrolase [Chlorobi bacterium]|nr:alpha/beta fold hydrolase [Chlorobiota bacterium]
MTTPVKLHFREYGDPNNPTVIILHGLFGMSDNWHTVSLKLADEFHVINVDLRNHGDSPWAEPMTYEAMAQDVAQLIKELNLSEVSIIGHSMGGKVAMHYALNGGCQTLRSLVVVDIAPVEYPDNETHLKILDLLEKLPLEQFSSRGQIVQWLSQYLPTYIAHLIAKNVKRDPNGKFRLVLNVNAIRKYYKELRKAITGTPCNKPTLFAIGEKSPFMKEDYKPIIKQLFPHSLFVTIKDAGHWVHSEKTEVFLDVVKNFLRQTWK